MAALPYMQLYVSDYLADTAHLTTEEHGAYLLLLFNYWQTGKPLRKDRLAFVARTPNERWPFVEETLREFFHDDGKNWVHFRVESDLDAVNTKSKTNSSAGKASARARAAKKAEAEALAALVPATNVGTNVERTHQRNVNHTDTDTDTDKETDKDQELLPSAVAPVAGQLIPLPEKPKRAAKPKTESQQACADTWAGYADAYFNRHGTEPVRNAKTNALITQLVQRLGAEAAPYVAAYYVTMNKTYYVSNLHPLGVLVKDCESIHTQWATNRQMTDTRSRQIDQSQANYDVAGEAVKIYNELYAGGDR